MRNRITTKNLKNMTKENAKELKRNSVKEWRDVLLNPFGGKII